MVAARDSAERTVRQVASAIRAGAPPPTDFVAVSTVEAMAARAPDEIRALFDWTLRQVVERYGSVPSLVNVLKAASLAATIDDKEVRTAQRRGELISRDLVRLHVVGAIDDSLQRLLQDSPQTLAHRARELVESGVGDEELEDTLRELIGAQVRGMKRKAIEALAATMSPDERAEALGAV